MSRLQFAFVSFTALTAACGQTYGERVQNQPETMYTPGGGTPQNPLGPGESLPVKPFPEGCAGNELTPTAGDKCTAACADCQCNSITYTCDKSCYAAGATCFVNAGPDGTVRPGPGYMSPCMNVTCAPDNDLVKELVCTATMCKPPPPPPSTCPAGSMPGPGTFGTKYECYGITSTTGDVWHLDRVAKKATYVCTKPSNLGPVEAFAVSPVTGNAFIIAQDTSDFGKFSPRDGAQTCVFTPMGKFPSSAVGGFAFSPNGTLYAGDESSGELWRFKRDGANPDPIAAWDLIGRLPNGSEGLAINPKDGLAYNSDGSTLHIVDLAAPGASLFSCSIGGGGFESIFFDRDGVLYSTNNMSNEFVTINVDRAGNRCSTTVLFSVSPATELEASDCNTGCAYETCVCR